MEHIERPLDVDERRRTWIEQEILRAIRAICYGSVEIIIHDSEVVQIERKEKVRLDKGRSTKGN